MSKLKLLSNYNILIICFIIGIIGICIYIWMPTIFMEPFEQKEKKIRILNLVLYSTDNGGPYDNMKNILDKYYSTFPYVDTYYYCFSPNLAHTHELKGNVLYIKGNETYIPGILNKTIFAFDYFKDKLSNYNYVIRSNISTIIRFDLVAEYFKHNTVKYGCTLCTDANNIPFSSGTSIIFSPDIITNIVNNKNKLDYSTIDDVSIGNFIQKHMPEIKMEPILSNLPNNGFYSVPNLDNDKNKILDLVQDNKIAIFRNRNDDNREIDVKQMNTIVDLLLEDATAQ